MVTTIYDRPDQSFTAARWLLVACFPFKVCLGHWYMYDEKVHKTLLYTVDKVLEEDIRSFNLSSGVMSQCESFVSKLV